MYFSLFERDESPIKALKFSALILLYILSLWGCAEWKSIPVTERHPLPHDRVQYLLSRLAMDSGQESLLKAMAHINIDHPGGKYTRKVAILAQRPFSLRVDAIPLFGPSDFFMSVNESFIKVFLPGEGVYYAGKPTKENLERFFRIPIPTYQMVSLLMGMPPISITDKLHVTGGYSDGNRHDRIDILSGDVHIQSLWIDAADNSLIKAEVFGKDGYSSYNALFDDFILLGKRAYPQRVRISMKGMEKIDVTIKYTDLEISKEVDTDAFDLPVPGGLQPVFLN